MAPQHLELMGRARKVVAAPSQAHQIAQAMRRLGVDGTRSQQTAFEHLVSGQGHERVTQFIVQVENSPFFREVEKISEDIDRGTFSFSCTLIY